MKPPRLCLPLDVPALVRPMGVALWLSIAALFGPGVAAAGDGRIEINQARALAGGVTAGDAPGFPVTISTDGSFVLTSDLVVPVDEDGLFVNGADTSIDLNGFSVVGPASCSGSPISCLGTGAGVGEGIYVFAGSAEIRNGSVRGFGSVGVRHFGSSYHFRLIDVEVRENGNDGVETNAASALLRGLTVVDNLGRGIDSITTTLLNDSLVSNNGSTAVFVGRASLVRGNTIDSTAAGATALRTTAGFPVAEPGYGQNVIWGTIQGGIDMGQNVCNGSTTC